MLMRCTIFDISMQNLLILETKLPDIRRCFDGDPGQVYKNDLSVSKKQFRKILPMNANVESKFVM